MESVFLMLGSNSAYFSIYPEQISHLSQKLIAGSSTKTPNYSLCQSKFSYMEFR